jgi:hypothetical protein
LPEGKRARLVRIVTRAVVARFGFNPRAITPTSGGLGVRIALRSGEACTSTSSTEPQLAALVHKAVPWLRRVQIVVGPSGRRLTDYAGARCRPATLPSGRGSVLLTQRGSALGSTTGFTTGSAQWSIEYLNESRLLQILVLRNGAPTGRPLIAQRRGPGRFVVRGAGRYSLQISSIGAWTVRVRDGA